MRKRDKPHKSYGQFLLCLSGMLFFVNSCGVVGSPLPPEDIGIEAKILAQKKAEKEKDREAEGEQTQNNKNPLMTIRDYYEVLGTSPDASDDEIE